MTLHDLKRLGRLARLAASGHLGSILLARTAIRRFGAIQRTWELASLIRLVKQRQPRTVLEIGTHTGGSLVCWINAAAADAHLISIDRPEPEEGLGASAGTDGQVRAVLRPRQRLTLIRADSHSDTARAQVKSALGGESIDFLWIDGDHSDAGVRADYATYGPLVRPGGMIAMHDIHPNPALPGNQVHPLWRELRGRHATVEIIDQDRPGGAGAGIGIIFVPAATPPGG